MSSGEKCQRNFHLHLPHLHQGNSNKKQVIIDVPKGCLAIKVGQGEEQQRFIVPVIYFNHPLFMQLLKEAEEEYGFDQKGTITIPCHVEEFRYVQSMIDREKVSSSPPSFMFYVLALGFDLVKGFRCQTRPN